MANSYRNLLGGLKEKTNPSCNKENLVRHDEKLFSRTVANLGKVPWATCWERGFEQQPLLHPYSSHSVIVTVKSTVTSLSAMKKDSCKCSMSPMTIISVLNSLLLLLGLKIQLESPPWVGIHHVHQHQGNGGTWLGMVSVFQLVPGIRHWKAWKRYSSSTSKKFRCFAWGCNQLPLALSSDLWVPSELMGDDGHASCFSFRTKDENICYFPIRWYVEPQKVHSDGWPILAKLKVKFNCRCPEVFLETEEHHNGGEWLESLLSARLEQKTSRSNQKRQMKPERTWYHGLVKELRERKKKLLFIQGLYGSWINNSLFLALGSVPWK